MSLLSTFLHCSTWTPPLHSNSPVSLLCSLSPLRPLCPTRAWECRGEGDMQNPREESTAHIGIYSWYTSGFKYVYTQISVLDEHTKVLKGNVVNRALPSLHGVSPKITLTVHLRKFSARMFTWSQQYQGILVPKQTLGPFLTLSVRNGPNLQSYLFQEYISLNPRE